MSFKSFVVSRVAQWITGEARLRANRKKEEAKRMQAGSDHIVTYFHQDDDPYSRIAVQVLDLLARRYEIKVKPYLVGPPPEWATAEARFLAEYARADAARLSKASGISLQADAIEAAKTALWPTQITDVAAAQKIGDQTRAEMGHFMSAMIHYGGEFYWGLDRLHYLEARLVELGLRKPTSPEAPIWVPPISPLPDATPRNGTKPTIEFFLSFRSPYTCIAAARVKALADTYGAELKLKFVLPMVMRGLQVPPMKGRYFTFDTAREARRLGIPFGKICDPLGAPVERGYSLLPWAIQSGRGYEFCHSFMSHVWSLGVDAGTDNGIEKIVAAAGLDWDEAKKIIGNNDWREEAEANRLELAEHGHWGVPCFKVDGTIVWGQDRLWVIEQILRA